MSPQKELHVSCPFPSWIRANIVLRDVPAGQLTPLPNREVDVPFANSIARTLKLSLHVEELALLRGRAAKP